MALEGIRIVHNLTLNWLRPIDRAALPHRAVSSTPMFDGVDEDFADSPEKLDAVPYLVHPDLPTAVRLTCSIKHPSGQFPASFGAGGCESNRLWSARFGGYHLSHQCRLIHIVGSKLVPVGEAASLAPDLEDLCSWLHERLHTWSLTRKLPVTGVLTMIRPNALIVTFSLEWDASGEYPTAGEAWERLGAILC